MPDCFFVSDLHGSRSRYETLLDRIAVERPRAVFFGGDLTPHPMVGRGDMGGERFFTDYLGDALRNLRRRLEGDFPLVLLILGNDDPRAYVESIDSLEAEGLLQHLHLRRRDLDGRPLYGCAWVPPTPFQLKDWERYDVGHGVDPGCLPPEEGGLSHPVTERELRLTTIAGDLEELAGAESLADSVWLFHSPPYDGPLDRAALDGRSVDHVPLDVHVGSIAIARFLEKRQPAVALCGHIHEAPRLTGEWRYRIGRTEVLSAAHDGPELSLVRFDPDRPADATRELL